MYLDVLDASQTHCSRRFTDRLSNACPLPWPAAPKYPIVSQLPSSSTKPDTSHSPAKGDSAWLRKHYLAILYDATGLEDVNERVSSFARALRRRRDAVTEGLQAASLTLDAFDRKYRPDILKTLDDPSISTHPLQPDERFALSSTLKDISAARPPMGGEGDTTPRRESPRQTLARLEIIEVKLQILILLELLARRQSGADITIDPDPPLRLYTDRLAIHQALSGLGTSYSTDGQARNAVELDDLQSFWKDMEDLYSALLPPVFIEFIRTKLFSGAALDALNASHASRGAHSPFHHPTPDLRRLAQAVSDAAAENAAKRVPESPTLAKFIANPIVPGPALPPRPFARSRSTLNTSFLSTRQFEMGARPLAPTNASTAASVSSASTNPSSSLARARKRKTVDPERIPPERAAATSNVLVGSTPRRPVSRLLAAETPVKYDDADDIELPETPMQ